MNIKINNTTTYPLHIQFKSVKASELTKNLDVLTIVPGAKIYEINDKDFERIENKLEFYEDNNVLTFKKVESKTPKVTEVKTDVLTEDTFFDCDDKDALEVFAAGLGLEIDKRKSLDNIKDSIAEAIAE